MVNLIYFSSPDMKNCDEYKTEWIFFSLCLLLFPNKVLKLKWHPFILLDYDLPLVWWSNVFSCEIWQSRMWLTEKVSYGNIKTWHPYIWCYWGFSSQVYSAQSEIDKYSFPLPSLLWQMSTSFLSWAYGSLLRQKLSASNYKLDFSNSQHLRLKHNLLFFVIKPL